MRQLKMSGGVLFSLTDAVPPPARWDYSFPDADPAEHPDIANTWFPDGQFHTRFAVHAFACEGRIVVVDCGIGAGASPYFGGLAGNLRAEMSKAGLDMAAVDHVLITHFHLDHVGWATDEAGQALFPNARYHAPEAEIAHWVAQGERAARPHHVEAYQKHVEPLLVSRRLEATAGGRRIATIGGRDVSYRPVPGHTVGHSAVVFESPHEILLIAGDTWHSPAQIGVPEWCHRADADPVLARASRNALAQWACDRQAIVTAGHFPERIAFGRIARDANEDLFFAPFGEPHA